MRTLPQWFDHSPAHSTIDYKFVSQECLSLKPNCSAAMMFCVLQNSNNWPSTIYDNFSYDGTTLIHESLHISLYPLFLASMLRKYLLLESLIKLCQKSLIIIAHLKVSFLSRIVWSLQSLKFLASYFFVSLWSSRPKRVATSQDRQKSLTVLKHLAF